MPDNTIKADIIKTNALTITFKEDFQLVVLKPSSGYFEGKIISIYQDAYGNVETSLVTPEELREKYLPTFDIDINLIKRILKI